MSKNDFFLLYTGDVSSCSFVVVSEDEIPSKICSLENLAFDSSKLKSSLIIGREGVVVVDVAVVDVVGVDDGDGDDEG